MNIGLYGQISALLECFFLVSKTDDFVKRKCICMYITFEQRTEVTEPECRKWLRLTQGIFGE